MGMAKVRLVALEELFFENEELQTAISEAEHFEEVVPLAMSVAKSLDLDTFISESAIITLTEEAFDEYWELYGC